MKITKKVEYNIPNDKDFLLKGVERITKVAINYYIEPVREEGKDIAEINGVNLRKDLGFTEEIEKIRTVLESDKFQTDAGVELQDKIFHSESNSLTYELSNKVHTKYNTS